METPEPLPVANIDPTNLPLRYKIPLRVYIWINGEMKRFCSDPADKEKARDSYDAALMVHVPYEQSLYIPPDKIESPYMQVLLETLEVLEFQLVWMGSHTCAWYNFVGEMPQLPDNVSTNLRQLFEQFYKKKVSLVLITGDGNIKHTKLEEPGWNYETNGLSTFDPDEFITDEDEPCTDVNTNVLGKDGTHLDSKGNCNAKSENKVTRSPAARENPGKPNTLLKQAVFNHSHRITKGTGRLPQTISQRTVTVEDGVPAANIVSKS